ncbi:glucose-6-phosphate isomerase [Roseomonas sp. CECT 9278]|uniref:glucose-6-phosphate isomerase n=1 Tax=Roseomonas sp. CECT 9278 TaxID=2845823 RepID=UPI001E3AA2D7|nr:glucose-6-phosphate isomerase [Roseomonas sp. CECT 9278]CAH0273661.1 Glucose-6-phosphate isomerase [Roseomonas sp. CECT 9278]
MPNDDADAAWSALMALARRPGARAIRPLFAADPERAARCTHGAGDVLLDLSRSAVSEDVLAALLRLARATDVAGFRDRMLGGAVVNPTEGRAALHAAQRGGGDAAVQATLARMQDFCGAVHGGALRGATGARFTDVVNIGIGGSDLGPAMVARALWTPAAPMRAHYLANVDAHAWEELRARLDPARTLVLVASKTFTTQETMTNAALVRAWLVAALGEAGTTHLAALSTNLTAAAGFGIPAERVFGFADTVGGRFSLWSAIGLSLALALGWSAFAALLAGARAMDEHFAAAPPAASLPLLLALTELWHVNGLGYPARAVLPYDERLARFPAHLQQLEMESLGKAVALDGGMVARATGPVVFGEPGTNAQHSFMQLIHQGPVPVPVDVILVANPDHAHADSHRKLLANGLAQAEALLVGKSLAEVRAEMAGADAARIAAIAPHRVFTGDRPSNVILIPRLTAGTLGQLVALYEHKVACLGALWGINPFDQWGVELGKVLAGGTLAALEGRAAAKQAATAASVAAILRLQGAP